MTDTIDPLAADPAVLESYRRALAEYGPVSKALGWNDDGTKLHARYRALTALISKETPFSLIDYGCGLGFLADWLSVNRFPVGAYGGVDPIQEMVDCARKNRFLPNASYWQASSPDLKRTNADHIVACGVFTRMIDRTPGEHLDHIEKTIETLFKHCRVGLHIDFLSDNAEWQEKTNFHASPAMATAICQGLSRRYIIDVSYLPYEFCIHIFKDAEIDHDTNQYRKRL